MSTAIFLRTALIATLAASMATGCARTPNSPLQAGALSRSGSIATLAKPVSNDATKLALGWQADAVQLGVSITRGDLGMDDVATYVFTSIKQPKYFLIVVAGPDGLVSQEVALNDAALSNIGALKPMRGGNLLESQALFAAAEKAGLKGAQSLLVLNGENAPVATVLDATGQNYILIDAVTGQALGPVARLQAERRVMNNFMLYPVLAVGAVMIIGIKKVVDGVRKRMANKPKPSPGPSGAPSNGPSPLPSAMPSPAVSVPPLPVPSTKPSVPPAPDAAALNVERIDGGSLLLRWRNIDVTTPINGEAPTSIKVFLREQPRWTAIHTVRERAGFGLFTLPPATYHFAICATARGVDGPVQAEAVISEKNPPLMQVAN